MSASTRRLSVVMILAIGWTARADDAPKPTDAPKDKDSAKPAATAAPQMHSAGQIVAKLSKSGDDSITVKLPTAERTTSSYRRAGTRIVEKDHDFDFTTDVKIRWHDLPKKADGKPYTDKEYQAIREPVSAPGYKADKSDLKPGQTVKLYLSKAGKDDKPVVSTVVIVADAPKHDDKKK